MILSMLVSIIIINDSHGSFVSWLFLDKIEYLTTNFLTLSKIFKRFQAIYNLNHGVCMKRLKERLQSLRGLTQRSSFQLINK